MATLHAVPPPQRDPSPFSDLVRYYTDPHTMGNRLQTTAQGSHHLTLALHPTVGSGGMTLTRFHSGLTVSTGDYAFREDMREAHPILGPQFGFDLLLDGRFRLTAPDLGVREPVVGGEIWIRGGDLGRLQTTCQAGRHLRGLSLDVPPDMVEAWREDAPQAFCPPLAGLIQQRRPLCARLPPPGPAVFALAEKILAHNDTSPCGRLHRESLALDLLARLLAPDPAQEQADSDRAPHRLSPRRRAALDEAMDILREEWMDPPTITRLARRVGLNECYLKAGFRERFGTTIAGHVRVLRMTEARRLIETEGQSVQQTALAVGFSNPSQFAAAFRRVHGMAPSQVSPRRHRL